MSYRRNAGSTNVSVELQILDTGTFLPKDGYTFDSAGIDLNYRRDGAVVTSITEASLGALTTAHTDGGFLQVANGRYRLDLPDAACATGVDQVTVGGAIASGIIIPRTIQLDLQDVNVSQVSDSTDAADNLELMFNGSGYTDDTAPASRSQINSIGTSTGGITFSPIEDNTGGAIDPSSATFVGSVTAGTFTSIGPGTAIFHSINDAGNDVDILSRY